MMVGEVRHVGHTVEWPCNECGCLMSSLRLPAQEERLCWSCELLELVGEAEEHICDVAYCIERGRDSLPAQDQALARLEKIRQRVIARRKVA